MAKRQVDLVEGGPVLPDVRLRREPVEGRVSVLIPSYLRPDDLEKTLTMTLRQNYPDTEIIVVDDGTPDAAIEKIVVTFPNVTYIRTPHNIGLIAARNFGALCCSGEFIINLDDDSWLEGDGDIAKIVDFLHTHPDCGVAALNIGLKNRGYLWPADAAPTAQRTYKGCGNVYRRQVIDLVGGYMEEFQRQGEEVERSLRIMDVGYRILSFPAVRVFHAQSAINRNQAKNLAFETANIVRRELIRAPWWLMPVGLARAIRFAARHWRSLDIAVLKSELMGDRVPTISFVIQNRKPVNSWTYLRALTLP